MRLLIGLTLIFVLSAGLGVGIGIANWLLNGDVVVAESQLAKEEVYWVQPGDNLWKIAREHYPNKDPRDIIDQLRKINNLSSATIFPGQKLRMVVER